jgi:hypothetical protein
MPVSGTLRHGQPPDVQPCSDAQTPISGSPVHPAVQDVLDMIRGRSFGNDGSRASVDSSGCATGPRPGADEALAAPHLHWRGAFPIGKITSRPGPY